MKTRYALLTAAAFALAAPALAQDQLVDGGLRDSIASRLVRGYEEELGRTTLGYWEPRLADYKRRFDAIFSPHDLEGLNELRVRFTMFLERQWQEEQEHARRASEYGSTTMDTAVTEVSTTHSYEGLPEAAITDTLDARYVDAASDTTMMVEEPYVEPEYDSAEYARREAEYAANYQREYDERIEAEMAGYEAEMAGYEAALARGEQIDGDSWLGVEEDFIELPLISRWLARRYRSNLDDVAGRVFDDLRGFASALDSFEVAFRARNVKELAIVPDAVHAMSFGSEFEGIDRLLRYPRLLKHTYVNQMEPLFLLYDGGGLARLIGTMMRRSSVPGELGSTMLAQVSPNPASGMATVSYSLPEASGETVLRVFDTQGVLVLEREEGARPAGEHSVTLDVSTLASGSYLCQITAKLSAGEKTSARILQVVR